MPTYDYECSTCDKTFEYFQSMSDDPLTSCPECGNEVKRLIGGGLGVIFKGSGFYVNDSKSAKSSTSSSVKTGSSSDTDSSAKENKKTEKKSEAKGGSDSAGSQKATA